MYAKTAGATGAAGGLTVLPDTGGFLHLGAAALLLFVAAFTLIAAATAIWRLLPRDEE